MPLDADATTVITGFRAGPPFIEGLVRDLRVRWAFEEIGRGYRAELFDAMAARPEGYSEWQPFGQVPAFADDRVRMFETGAMLLYLGEQDERLLPREPQAKWRAVSWAFAALNSVEPFIAPLLFTNVVYKDEAWAGPAREAFLGHARRRLGQVEAALGQGEWLAGDFSLADILMVTVLRQLDRTGELAAFPALADYKARGEARPAFGRALADHLAGFDGAAA